MLCFRIALAVYGYQFTAIMSWDKVFISIRRSQSFQQPKIFLGIFKARQQHNELGSQNFDIALVISRRAWRWEQLNPFTCHVVTSPQVPIPLYSGHCGSSGIAKVQSMVGPTLKFVKCLRNMKKNVND